MKIYKLSILLIVFVYSLFLLNNSVDKLQASMGKETSESSMQIDADNSVNNEKFISGIPDIIYKIFPK